MKVFVQLSDKLCIRIVWKACAIAASERMKGEVHQTTSTISCRCKMLRRTATELEPKCLKWDSRIGQFYRDDAAAVEHDQCTTSDYESEHPELGDGSTMMQVAVMMTHIHSSLMIMIMAMFRFTSYFYMSRVRVGWLTRCKRKKQVVQMTSTTARSQCLAM